MFEAFEARCRAAPAENPDHYRLLMRVGDCQRIRCGQTRQEWQAARRSSPVPGEWLRWKAKQVANALESWRPKLLALLTVRDRKYVHVVSSSAPPHEGVSRPEDRSSRARRCHRHSTPAFTQLTGTVPGSLRTAFHTNRSGSQ